MGNVNSSVFLVIHYRATWHMLCPTVINYKIGNKVCFLLAIQILSFKLGNTLAFAFTGQYLSSHPLA